MKKLLIMALLSLPQHSYAGKEEQHKANFKTYAMAAVPVGLVGVSFLARRQISVGMRHIAQAARHFRMTPPVRFGLTMSGLYVGIGIASAAALNHVIAPRRASAMTDPCALFQTKTPQEIAKTKAEQLYHKYASDPDLRDERFRDAYLMGELSGGSKAISLAFDLPGGNYIVFMDKKTEETQYINISKHELAKAIYHIRKLSPGSEFAIIANRGYQDTDICVAALLDIIFEQQSPQNKLVYFHLQ